MKRKNETALYGYMKGLTDQLIWIKPDGREAIERHIKALRSFRKIVADAAEMEGGGIDDGFERLDYRIMELVEEFAEQLEEIKRCPKVKDEKRCIGFEIGELNGVSAELSAIHIKLIQMQERIKERMPHGLAVVAMVKHLKALEDTLHDAGLMADGIISRFESIRNGVFDE